MPLCPLRPRNEGLPHDTSPTNTVRRNLRKICLLLQAFEDLHKSIDYYALDLSQKELERTLSHVPDFEYVSCHGLLGTYDDGVTWLKQPGIVNKTKCIIHLGSSIGKYFIHLKECSPVLLFFPTSPSRAPYLRLSLDSLLLQSRMTSRGLT